VGTGASVRIDLPRGGRPAREPALPRFFTTFDVAHAFGWTERAARLACETGRIPAFKVGKSWFIRPEAFWTFVAEQEKRFRLAPQQKREAVRDALDVVLRNGRRGP